MLFIAIGSIATAGSFVFILYSLSPKLLKTVLGYRVWADILLSGGLTLMGLATGTISGLVIGSLSAIAMTLTLLFMKKALGYRKLEKDSITGKRVWVDYEGTMTSESIADFIKQSTTKISISIKKFFNNFNGAKI